MALTTHHHTEISTTREPLFQPKPREADPMTLAFKWLGPPSYSQSLNLWADPYTKHVIWNHIRYYAKGVK
jgi:hypothetical protein